MSNKSPKLRIVPAIIVAGIIGVIDYFLVNKCFDVYGGLTGFDYYRAFLLLFGILAIVSVVIVFKTLVPSDHKLHIAWRIVIVAVLSIALTAATLPLIIAHDHTGEEKLELLDPAEVEMIENNKTYVDLVASVWNDTSFAEQPASVLPVIATPYSVVVMPPPGDFDKCYLGIIDGSVNAGRELLEGYTPNPSEARTIIYITFENTNLKQYIDDKRRYELSAVVVNLDEHTRYAPRRFTSTTRHSFKGYVADDFCHVLSRWM